MELIPYQTTEKDFFERKKSEFWVWDVKSVYLKTLSEYGQRNMGQALK